MNFIIIPIDDEFDKEEVYKRLASMAKELGYKPNDVVAGTEDEKYNLMKLMLKGLAEGELKIVKMESQT